MLKKYTPLYFYLFIALFLNAQIQKPVKWNYNLKKIDKNSAVIQIIGKVENGWHIYSNKIEQGAGLPTKINFKINENLKLEGVLIERGELISKYSQVFGATLKYFNNKVVYEQKVGWGNNLDKIIVDVEYQVCNDKICLTPDLVTLEIPISKNSTLTNQNTNTNQQATSYLKINSIDVSNPLTKSCAKETSTNESFLTIIFLGFLGGFLALLTPCVFPMIPLTISYFTKSKRKIDALLFSFFIFLIFVSLSLPFYLIEGIVSDVFNQISTNIWVNLTFFFIFIFFAFSLLGFYEISLPSSLLNKSDKASDQGGIIGVFFLAFTLVLVSFSCTGPILGSLLVGAIDNTNGALKLTSALAGFGFSWSLVFGILSLFPNYLNSLPKSGNWLSTIKVTLGFLEIALAIKFLSKADLVAKTNFISRELFIVFWLFIFIGLLLVLLNKIKLPKSNFSINDFPKKIILTLTFLLISYLFLGLVFKDTIQLKLFSGLLPPKNHINKTTHNNCPLGINCYNDYFSAIEVAKKNNKPILIDFTGWGCENCRRMEENVWTDEAVYQILSNEVILTSLYVDDSEKLFKPEEIIQNNSSRKILTIGNKWSIFQAQNFNSNSQPQYALVTPEGELINYPIAGYVSKKKFIEFLNCGLGYHKNKPKK
ncbi:MAG: cytochrome c biogenesis protein CcdA [Solirubrobacteraceae bacterium]